MTVYADNEFYTGTYRKNNNPLVPIELFGFYARKASSYINQYTFDNIGENVPNTVKLCCCDLAEALYNIDNSLSAGGISSERVGDVSVNYESEEIKRQNLPKTVRNIIYSWLGDTGLLFSGGRLC